MELNNVSRHNIIWLSLYFAPNPQPNPRDLTPPPKSNAAKRIKTMLLRINPTATFEPRAR